MIRRPISGGSTKLHRRPPAFAGAAGEWRKADSGPSFRWGDDYSDAASSASGGLSALIARQTRSSASSRGRPAGMVSPIL